MRKERFVFPIMKLAIKNAFIGRILNPLFSPYNPFDPRRVTNPSLVYEKVRAKGPIYYHKTLGRWIVTGYEEAAEVLKADGSVDRTELIFSLPPWNKLNPRTVLTNTNSMLLVDPPRHTRLRSLVNRAFTPKTVKNFTPTIVSETDRLLEAIDLNEPTNIVEAFCTPLPLIVISKLLGIPDELIPAFDSAGKTIVKFVDDTGSFDPEEMDRETEKFRLLIRDLAKEKAKNPEDDLISKLVAVGEDGDKLDQDELESMCILLLLAGFETTRNFIASSLVTLAREPEQRSLLVNKPDLIENAVEELLRFETPVQVTDRTFLNETVVAGKTIKAKKNVMILLGAVNRDPRKYDNPNELQLDREKPHPMSLGHGIHHCLGAALARLESQIALSSFLKAYPNYVLDEERLVWSTHATVKGPKEVWLTAG